MFQYLIEKIGMVPFDLVSVIIQFGGNDALEIFKEFAKYKVPDIFERGPKGVGNFVATKLNTSGDIYGKDDVANLGDKELNIRLKPVDFKINVSN